MPRQPTSVRVLPTAGSEYTVEHKNGVVTDQYCIEDLRTKFAGYKIMAFQQDTSEQGYSPGPSLCSQKGLGL